MFVTLTRPPYYIIKGIGTKKNRKSRCEYICSSCGDLFSAKSFQDDVKKDRNYGTPRLCKACSENTRQLNRTKARMVYEFTDAQSKLMKMLDSRDISSAQISEPLSWWGFPSIGELTDQQCAKVTRFIRKHKQWITDRKLSIWEDFIEDVDNGSS